MNSSLPDLVSFPKTESFSFPALIQAGDFDFAKLSLGRSFTAGKTICAQLFYDGKPVHFILRGAPVTIAARTDDYAKRMHFKLPEDKQGASQSQSISPHDLIRRTRRREHPHSQ